MTNLVLGLAEQVARLLPMQVKIAIYRAPTLAGFLRRALNRAAPGGLTKVRVAAGALKGIHLRLDLQSEKDYWLGTYEVELQTAISDLVKPGMVVYDLGANIGYITIMLAQAVGEQGQVFGFEALPENVDRLRENLELNGLEGRVNVVGAAATDGRGEAEFLCGSSGGMGKVAGSAGRPARQEGITCRVPTTSLDHFVLEEGNLPPAAVKMDIEGGEILALPGMKRVIGRHRPILLMELHGEAAIMLAWEMLKTQGYTLHRMSPGYPEVKSKEELEWKAYLVAMPPIA
jgi:FkbM family methyltransferase